MKFKSIKSSKSVIGFQENGQYEELVRRWVLRLLGPGKVVEMFGPHLGSQEEKVLQFVGLSEKEIQTLSLPRRIKKIDLLWKRDEKKGEIEVEDGCLEANVWALQKHIGLSILECEIIHFLVLLKTNHYLTWTAEETVDLNTEQLFQLVALVLNQPIVAIRKAFSNQSLLLKSGLVEIDNDLDYLSRKVDLLTGLENRMFSAQGSVAELFEHLIIPGRSTQLCGEDFSHIAMKRERIKSYLNQAINHHLSGVNILIHGEPGVGKTAVVRSITQEFADVKLFELATMNEVGNALSGSSRFKAYKLSQNLLLKHQKSVILFDEIEDVFSSDPFAKFFGGSSASEMNSKSWINELLETNPVPAFWVTNAIHQMDPAYLRRFDMVVEIEPMSTKSRTRMLNKLLKGLPLTETWVDKMAHHQHLHPGQIERAKKVVYCMASPDAASTYIEHELETLIGETQVAMGNPKKPPSGLAAVKNYDLNYLNADADLKKLVEGLGKNNSARMCLYGCPGSGKTAYASYLAKQLDKPLISKRGSDLLGMYVGQTEKQIAAMFEQAEEQDAVLLLDEGDSFLMDRTTANQNWQVSQVNELLTQMEQFEGIFIIATNLMENLDAASLRRFDFKIKFDYLLPNQALNMFKSVADQLHINSEVDERIETRVRDLDKLTPGDFSTVVRRANVVKGIDCMATLVIELEKEVQAKQGNISQRIGFI